MARISMGILFYGLVLPVFILLSGFSLAAKATGLGNNPITRWLDQQDFYDEVSRSGD